METEIIKKIGGLRGEFWPVDDTDLWNRVSENGFIVYALPKILLKYKSILMHFLQINLLKEE